MTVLNAITNGQYISDQADIKTAEISAIRILPHITHAFVQPTRVLGLLENIAGLGDRVKVTHPLGGHDAHFLFHPTDIDRVLRKAHKSFSITPQQYKMLKSKGGKIHPTIVNSKGKQWETERRKLAKHVHSVKGLDSAGLETVSEEVDRLIESWKDKDQISLGEESSDLFIRLGYRILFGQEAANDTAKKLGNGASVINRHQYTVALSNGLLRPLSEQWPKLKAALDDFHSEVSAVRVKYLEQLADEGKEIGILLDDLHDDIDPETADARIAMMIRASHTTMTYTLFNAVWNLADRPDLQARIANQDPNDQITHQVIQETMRLTPPITVIPKQANENVQVDEDYIIREGETVIISPHVTGRDPRFYQRPEEFLPDIHFEREAELSRHRDAFIPYGIGPRKCPGRGMAEQQLSIILSKVCANFEFKKTTQADPVPQATFIMLPDRSCKISVQPRAQ
ncbi:MAG: cytochrome P450 [Pseudomonadota bacterium]